MSDSVVRIGTEVDVSALQSGMQQATSSVENFASRARAATDAYNAAAKRSVDVQKALGAAFDQAAASGATFVEAQEQAVAAVSQLTVAAKSATSAVTGLSLSARQAGTAGISILEGRLTGSNRAASAFLSTTLGLGPVLQAAFPVIGAIAIGEVLVQVGKSAYHLYENLVNLKAAFQEVDSVEQEAASHAKSFEDHLEEQRIKYIELTQGIVAATRAEAAFYSQKPVNNAPIFESAAFKKLPDSVKHSFEDQYKAIDPKDLPEKIKALGDEIQALQAKVHAPADTAKIGALGQFGLGEALSDTRDTNISKARLQVATALYSELTSAQADYTQTTKTFDAEVADEQKKQADKGAKAYESAERKREEAARRAAEFEERVAKLGIGPSEEAAQRRLAISTKMYDTMQQQSGEAVGKMAERYDQGLQAQAQAATAAAEGKHQQAQLGFQTREEQIRGGKETGQLNPEQALAALRKLHADELAEEKNYIQQLIAIDKDNPDADPKQLQKLQNDLANLPAKGALVNSKDTDSQLQLIQQKYESFFSKIDSAFQSSVDSWLRGQQNFSRSMLQIYDQLGLQLTNALLKMGLQWIRYEAATLAAHRTANLAKTTSDQQAASQTAAIKGPLAIKEIGSDAAGAAAGAWKALSGIPIIGPELGAVAAAAAFAGVMAFESLASFDVGTSYVPKTGVAKIHEGERVIPRSDNEQITSALRGGGSPQSGQAGRAIHMHFAPSVNAFDGPSAHGMIRQYGRQFLRENMRQLRRMNLIN